VTGRVQRRAATLNSACQCLWLDRGRLDAELARDPALAPLFAARTGLVADNVVFLDAADAAAMDRTIALAGRALDSTPFRQQVAAQAPALAAAGRPALPGLLGFDFHLGAALPQLIEINTNPGGLLINEWLARAVAACCPEAAAVLAPPADQQPASALTGKVPALFRAAWTAARGTAPLVTIALVDDDPPNQYLYPEFLLFQQLFAAAGWRCLIADPQALAVRDGALYLGATRIDLVYNRLTDFYLTEERHAALARAEREGCAVLVPNPAAHAHYADKRLLAALGDKALLTAAGLEAGEREQLRAAIPMTELVSAARADEFWRRRKELFFKPVDGYGSKAAYRGDKLTRATFQQILAGRYVAQALAATSMRRVVVAGTATELRVDIRNYCGAGATWLRAARLYRGQTTNFRTPGGGFAPVVIVAADSADAGCSRV